MKEITDITIDQVKQDDNFLCSLNLSDINVFVSLQYTGGNNIKYFMFLNNELLFSGNDFRSSPFHNQDDIESIISLLGFLTLKPGDTDEDYFEKYTENQMNWAKSFECEQLSGLVSDFDNNNEPEYHNKAVQYFTNAFN